MKNKAPLSVPVPEVYRLAAKLIEDKTCWFAVEAIVEAACQFFKLETVEQIQKSDPALSRYIHQYQEVFRDFSDAPFDYWLKSESTVKNPKAARGTRATSLSLMADICEQGL